MMMVTVTVIVMVMAMVRVMAKGRRLPVRIFCWSKAMQTTQPLGSSNLSNRSYGGVMLNTNDL